MEEYRKMKRLVKRMVRGAKKRVNEEWTLSIAKDLKKIEILERSKLGQKGRESEAIIYDKFDERGVNSGE